MGWYRFTIIVPNADNAGNETPPELLAHVGAKLGTLGTGGGWSETVQRGGWPMPDGSVCHEASTRFETIGARFGFSEDMTLRSLAKHVAVTIDQDAVLYMVEPLPDGTTVGLVRQDDAPNID